MLKTAIWASVVTGVLFTIPALGAENELKGKYQNIEVVRFEIQEGVNFPPDYLITMTNDIVEQLKNGKKFKEVLREGERPEMEGAPTLRLTGTVIKFKKGSRGLRYMAGPVGAAAGAGKTLVVANIKFTDTATNETLFEKKVDGRVVMGIIGGESTGATRGLAKEIAKVSNERFFK
jgi:Domain of unknown function (DUF4410)